MKIKIKTITGQTFDIEVEENDTIIQVKDKIKAEKNYKDDEELKLIFKGKHLNEDSKTLKELSILENAIVICMVKKVVNANLNNNPELEKKEENIGNNNSNVTANPIPPPLNQNTQPNTEATISPEHEPKILELVNLGFSREDAIQALIVSNYNSEYAANLLLSGDFNANDDHPNKVQISSEHLILIKQFIQTPEFEQLKANFQTNPEQTLMQIVQILQSSNPSLFTFFTQNPNLLAALFTNEEILNQIKNLNIPENYSFNANNDNNNNNNTNPSPVQPQPQTVEIDPEDEEAINRLSQLGFSKQACYEAYMVCDKNEELAANYLFENNN